MSDDVFVSPEDFEDDTPLPMSAEDEGEFIEATRAGKAQREFNIFGNEIVMHTLSIKETLEASQVAKQYRDTHAEALALKTAMVAMALDTINGEDFYRAISAGENHSRSRFKKLSNKYYSDFVNELYLCYRELEEEQHKIVTKAKKVQG